MRDLYPPILPSYIPAFDCNSGTSVRVYFQMSHYNSFSSVSHAQITVRFQSNNTSALKKTESRPFYTEILIRKPQEVSNSENADYPYFVDIPFDCISDILHPEIEGFQPDYIYKVQIRLSDKPCTGRDLLNGYAPTASYINDNINHFSEWSTVCLLKPINKPTIGIREFTSEYDNANADEAVLSMTEGDAVFTGFYELATNSNETPLSWRMRLYENNALGFVLIGDSGEKIFNTYDYMGGSTNNSIPFTYDFKKQLEAKADKKYKLILDVTSKNGYFDSVPYIFTATQGINTDFEPTLSVEINEDDAYAIFKVYEGVRRSIILTLRRSSSKDNFVTWEDISSVTIRSEITDITFYDYTIESGVFYKYGLQVRDNSHRRSALIDVDAPVRGEFEYAYLLGHSQGLDESAVQLRLSYNFSVSSYATTVMEAKVDTIGSKYPFISRNGNTFYRTFPISGLISYHMDEAELFTSRSKTYKEQTTAINNDNNSKRYLKKSLMDNQTQLSNSYQLYDEMYDYTYERDFREQVMAFLYDNKPKLYKSATEGNILVKLMDITFTPKPELGRLVYDFSATAYEIDEPTLENLNNYGIQTIDSYSIDLTYSHSVLGQISSFDYDIQPNEDINTLIFSRSHIGEIYDGIQYESGMVRYLRITFESQPYLINKNTKAPANGSISNDDGIIGWILQYNDQPIIIQYPNNIYEFKDDNIAINKGTHIISPVGIQATIDYVIDLNQKPADADKYVSRIEYQRKIGQVWDRFKSGNNFINTITYRYFYNETEYYQQINNWFFIDIEADPNTVFYLKSTADNELHRYIINFTGNLHIEPDESTVTFKQGYFYGINVAATAIHTTQVVTELPTAAQEYDSCEVDGQLYIYYQKEWRQAIYQSQENSYDIACPVDGIVNYYVQIVKGIYKQ